MTLAVGTVLASSPTLPLFNFMHWCSWVCFICQFHRINFYLQIYPSSMHVCALETFYGIFFLLALIDLTWSQVFM
jgi:hypothetical protein